MINIFVLTLCLTLPLIAWGHDHIPTANPHDKDLKYELNLNVSKKFSENWTSLVAAQTYTDDSNNSPFALTWLNYYRVATNFKVGFLWKWMTGAIHSEDWIRDSNSNWGWRDTNDRSENSGGVDLTYRLHLTPQWVGEFKTRYIRNFFNNHNTLFLRPGVTYFMQKNNKPFINLYIQYAYDYPLNFHVSKKFMEWIYVGTMYHYSARIKPGLFISYKKSTWLTTESNFEALFPGQSYLSTEKDFILGARLNIIL